MKRFDFVLISRYCGAVLATACLIDAAGSSEPVDRSVSQHMVMHATFDDVTDLNLSSGEGWISTAATYQDVITRQNILVHKRRSDAVIEPDRGLFGDSLRFRGVSEQVLFYKGDEFTNQRSTTPTNWSVTIACWVRFQEDALSDGLSSIPLQLTQPKVAGSTLTVECESGSPHELRLVASSGPIDTVGDTAVEKRHVLVRVRNPPIGDGRWMHLAIMLDRVNSDDWTPSHASLYMNGRLMGRPEVSFPMFCDLSKASLVLGHNFIGQIDDLGVFDHVLSADQMRKIYDRRQRLR